MTILFVIFILLLALFSPQKFWFILILGVAFQLGLQLGMVGTIVLLGIGKVVRDLIYAGSEE